MGFKLSTTRQLNFWLATRTLDAFEDCVLERRAVETNFEVFCRGGESKVDCGLFLHVDSYLERPHPNS